VESPQGRKPMGTRRQKSELVSSFCRLATPRLVPADLEPGADPERSEGARPNKKYNQLTFVSNKPNQTEKMIENICLLQPKLDNASASHIYFIGQ